MGLGQPYGVTPSDLMAAVPQSPEPAGSNSFVPNADGEPGPAPALNLPNSMLVSDLEKVNPEYDAETIEQYGLLYDAGKRFRRRVDKFIVRRQVEESEEACGEFGNKHYEARKKRSWYIPRGPGVLDWIIDSTFKKGLKVRTQEDEDEKAEATPQVTPQVTPEGPKNLPSEDSYWGRLNRDADGQGNSINQVAKNAQRQIELYGRGYFYLHFDKAEATADDKSAKDACIRYMPAASVDDWERAPDGTLLWVRTHTTSLVRSQPPKAADTERHYWTYITPEEIVVYTADRGIGKPWEDKQPARRLTQNGAHDFGRMPLYEIPAPDGTHIMDRLYETLVALYNREISITFALDQVAFPMLLFKLENNRDLGKVVASEMAAVKLGSNEDMMFKSPDPQIFDPLFKDAERLKKAVYEVLQASALTTASQTQNARQSATAKLLDRDLLHVLLVAFAEPIRNTLETIIEDLKEYRGEESAEIELVGLDEFDATMDEVEALLSGNSKAAQPVPGTKQIGDAAVGDSKEDTED